MRFLVAAMVLSISLAGCGDQTVTTIQDFLVPNPQWEILTAHPHNASCTGGALCKAVEVTISTRISNATSAKYVDFIYSGRTNGGPDGDQTATRFDGPERFEPFSHYELVVWFPKAFAWDGRQIEVIVDGPTWKDHDKANIDPW